MPSNGKALRSLLDKEGADAAMAGLGIGAREDDDEMGLRSV